MSILKRGTASLFTTLGMLTRIPLPFPYTPDFTLFPFFFPAAGVFFTAILVLVYTAASAVLTGTVVLSALILLTQYLMFNLFHYDGLLDSADALLYRTDTKTKLKILKDKSSGSFAVFAGTVYLITKFALLNELIPLIDNLQGTVLLFLYIFAGRAAGSLVPALTSPARSSGLGFLLKNYSKTKLAAGFLISLSILFVFFHFTNSAEANDADGILAVLQVSGTACAAALPAGVFSALVFKKAVGGFTGDTIGMAVELGELAYLASLAATQGV